MCMHWDKKKVLYFRLYKEFFFQGFSFPIFLYLAHDIVNVVALALYLYQLHLSPFQR